MNDFPHNDYPPRPAIPAKEGKSGGTSPLWIISAMTIGFLLPICACGILITAGFVGLGGLASSLDDIEAQDTGSGAGVAVLNLEGVIFQGTGIGAATETVLRDIEWFEDNNDVKAIVVNANSPGGDANASDIIWNRLAQVQKPVLVSINGLCASGCYYIAMGANPNEIYATPNSLVGSIGVISTFINVEELADEIGVEVQIVATGDSKDFGSPFRELTESEIAFWREQIADTLENFITRVDGGRPNLTTREVRALATGQVWSASNAEQEGLIDGILYPQEVLDKAADMAGLGSNYRVIESPYEPTFFDLFFSSSPGFSTKIELPSAGDVNNALQQSPIQYRYLGPYSGALDND